MEIPQPDLAFADIGEGIGKGYSAIPNGFDFRPFEFDSALETLFYGIVIVCSSIDGDDLDALGQHLFS